jgi:hypothetical protein
MWSSSVNVRSTPGALRDNSEMLQVSNPSGGAYSTVGDMIKFANALTSHKLLTPTLTDTVLAGKLRPPDQRSARRSIRLWLPRSKDQRSASRRAQRRYPWIRGSTRHLSEQRLHSRHLDQPRSSPGTRDTKIRRDAYSLAAAGWPIVALARAPRLGLRYPASVLVVADHPRARPVFRVTSPIRVTMRLVALGSTAIASAAVMQKTCSLRSPGEVSVQSFGAPPRRRRRGAGQFLQRCDAGLWHRCQPGSTGRSRPRHARYRQTPRGSRARG